MTQDGSNPGTRAPAPKISASLLLFAQPLLDGIREEADGALTRAQLDQVLQLSVVLWNAVVLEQRGRGRALLERARDLVRAGVGDEATEVLLNNMRARKHELFAADLRVIGACTVRQTREGEIEVHVDTVAPEAWDGV